MATTPKRPAAKKQSTKVKKVQKNKDQAATQPSAIKDRASMISEAAYYKAEQRGFSPGHEWQDWYEAEREVSAALDPN